MISYLRVFKMLRPAPIVISAFLLFGSAVNAKTAATTEKVEVVRFDAVLELSAPILGTHVTICARYWVTPSSYSVAVLWAEPHVSGLNFPTYPPSLNIHSNEQSFSIANQIHLAHNSTFARPIGPRGVFRNKFNNYPLTDIRFAEPEALASRIYTSDLQKTAGSGRQTVDLRDSATKHGPAREVAKVNLDMKDGRLETMKLMDPNEKLVKSIEYEYAGHNGRDVLRRQNIVLPERPLTVGFRTGGATIGIGDKKQTYKELPGSHHRGGRKCAVEYRPLRVGDKALSLPASITVRNAETNAVLRIARMFNFVASEMDADEARLAASQFGRLDDDELKVRELWEKYWEQGPDAVEKPDVEVLKQLRRHFESGRVRGKTVGHKLKRANMPMELDWIQGNDVALQEHFKQYLDALTSSGLNNTALVGGLNVVGSTVGWSRFAAAVRMLADLFLSVKRNLAEARELFDEIDEPTRAQRMLMQQVDRLEGELKRASS